MKKIISLVLCLLMIFALVACGGDKREIVKLTLSTEDAEAILAAAGIVLPNAETVAAAGSTVKFHKWTDDFHNYSEEEIVNTGYWTFSEKYGCEVEWIECEYGTRFDDLANLILSGNSPDFTTVSVNTFPYYCLKGMFQTVNQYIDYEDPLWAGNKEFSHQYFSMGGFDYSIIVDVKATNVCVYNRRVVDEWGFDDPAELYYNDEWTWDVFYQMCLDFSDPDEDRYALDGWNWSQALIDSTGVTVVAIDDAGTFYHDLDNPLLETVQDYIYNISKNEACYPSNPRDNATTGAGIKDGKCLFYPVEKWGFTGTVEEVSAVWGDITAGEVMFCPMPRNENGDGNYYIAAQPVGYHIIEGAENPEGVVLLCMCERFKILDPTVISFDERQLKEKYLWTDEMMEMNQICYELANNSSIVNFTSGCQPQLRTAIQNALGGTKGNNPTTWAQSKERYMEQITYYVDELNALVAEQAEKLAAAGK